MDTMKTTTTHRWQDIRRTTGRSAARQTKAAKKEASGGRSLTELRRLLGVTQVELAARLEQRQTDVSQFESRTDHKISSLRAYVEALGGKLLIIAEFPEDLPDVGNAVTLRDV